MIADAEEKGLITPGEVSNQIILIQTYFGLLNSLFDYFAGNEFLWISLEEIYQS